ncbi:MAG: ABC transporter ATP-binding protein, partial [Halanaeroarchaeum sp.]
MLEVESLDAGYGDLQVLEGVDLSVDRGEYVAIVGPNGAGKTTLINLLTGLLEPDEGQVVMDGDDITDMPPHQRVHEGLVRSFQVVHVFEEMTIRENLRTSVLSKEKRTRKMLSRADSFDGVEERVDELLEMFRMEDTQHDVAEELPHGDRKLLDVAMSFGLDPEYLLLDEPTSGVSAQETDYVIDTITEVSEEQNVTTVTIEHDMDLVRGYADRVI